MVVVEFGEKVLSQLIYKMKGYLYIEIKATFQLLQLSKVRAMLELSKAFNRSETFGTFQYQQFDCDDFIYISSSYKSGLNKN